MGQQKVVRQEIKAINIMLQTSIHKFPPKRLGEWRTWGTLKFETRTNFDVCYQSKNIKIFIQGQNAVVAFDINLGSESLEQTVAVNSSSVNKTTLIFGQIAHMHGGDASPCQLPSLQGKQVAHIRGRIVPSVLGPRLPILLVSLCYKDILNNFPQHCCIRIYDFIRSSFRKCVMKCFINTYFIFIA